MNILILGLGNIGYRHLESLSKIKDKVNITIIEKIKSKTLKINKLILNNNIDIKVFNKIPSNQKYDLSIICTNSDVRYSAVLNLIKLNKLQFIILEKVVFDNKADYYKFQKLINDKNIHCFVNYPRNMMRCYKELKKEFIKDKVNKFVISGKNWGIMSNSLHFLNLISFMINKNNLKIKDVNLHDRIYKSKRNGFHELKGSLSFAINDTKIFLEDSNIYNSNIITIDFSKTLIKISEAKKKIQYYNKINNKNNEKSFDFKFQSELTFEIYEAIKNKKKICLPTYDETYKFDIIIHELIDRLKKRNIIFRKFKFT